jgi:hypothetical protein
MKPFALRLGLIRVELMRSAIFAFGKAVLSVFIVSDLSALRADKSDTTGITSTMLPQAKYAVSGHLWVTRNNATASLL